MSQAIMEKLRSRKRQCGQALYLSLAAIVFLSLMTYAAFNISQMTQAKSQTMNAADAGAYMAATVVARDLNFMAYSNRAMAANHAVIGQLVSMASLSQMLYLAANDISKLHYLSWIPYVGAILDAIADAFDAVKDAIDDYVLPGLVYFAKAQNLLIEAISNMQQVVHGATGLDMLNVDKVIKANDPELRWATTSGAGGLLTTAGNAASIKDAFFGSFSKQLTDDEAMGRMREVVNLSRDGFTKERGWVPTFSPIKTKFFFHGGTQLSRDNKTWVGVDAFDITVKRLWPQKDWKISFWATGEVAGSSGASDWKNLSHGQMRSGTHNNAYRNRKNRMRDTYSGIQPYQELTQIKPGDRSSDSPTFVILTYKPVQSANTSNVTRTPNATQTFGTDDADNPFHLDEGRAKIYGVAASQVYFRRPTKAENDPTAKDTPLPNSFYNNGTYASLFSPYWQARLTDVPSGIKTALGATVND